MESPVEFVLTVSQIPLVDIPFVFFFPGSSFPASVNQVDETRAPTFGDRPSSDVVVRLRTPEGPDDWLYCHSEILTAKSKYFDDRLSENWPTMQILDSRHCVEVYCQESDIDDHVNVLRLFCLAKTDIFDDVCLGVGNALGLLGVAVELNCPFIVFANCICISYIEAVPWDEPEE